MTSIYRTARGRPVDIVSIAKKNENRIALGNAHMNGRGDILGKGGKVIETREEQLKKFYEGNRIKNKVQETVNLKEDSRKEIESELQQVQEDRFVKAKARVKRPVYTDITPDEEASYDKIKFDLTPEEMSKNKGE